MEGDRISAKIEGKEGKHPRGGREGIHNERRRDVRRVHGRIEWISVIVLVHTWILQAISKGERLAELKWIRFVKGYRLCDFESDELERGWIVVVVADIDAHRQGCCVVSRTFHSIGWSECWCTRVLHAERIDGRDCDAQQSSYIRGGADKRKLLESSRWTAAETDGLYFRKKIGRFRNSFLRTFRIP